MALEYHHRYEIIERLGQGGMAQVYLAVCRGPADFNKLVVVKKIRPELSQDEKFITMFLDEARLVARLNHPNVVHTYDVVEHEGEYLLAMEYLDGQSLAEVFTRVRRKTIPVPVHLWILTQVLEGLHHAHTLVDYDGTSLGIVHRDVNPANILVTHHGEVKLVDFGIAKVHGALSPSNLLSPNGKAGYSAPEQWRGIEVDAKADIFAVGIMLWESLAGMRLTRGVDPAEVVRNRKSGKEPRIRTVQPDVPAALADICDRAMAFDPRDRFASAAEFQGVLEQYLRGLPARPGREQVAELMQASFGQERVIRRKKIELHLEAATVAERAAAHATVTRQDRNVATPPAPMPAKSTAAIEVTPPPEVKARQVVGVTRDSDRARRNEEDFRTPVVSLPIPDGAYLPSDNRRALTPPSEEQLPGFPPRVARPTARVASAPCSELEDKAGSFEVSPLGVAGTIFSTAEITPTRLRPGSRVPSQVAVVLGLVAAAAGILAVLFYRPSTTTDVPKPSPSIPMTSSPPGVEHNPVLEHAIARQPETVEPVARKKEILARTAVSLPLPSAMPVGGAMTGPPDDERPRNRKKKALVPPKLAPQRNQIPAETGDADGKPPTLRPTGEALEPGADLKAETGKRAARKIDEEDPYAP